MKFPNPRRLLDLVSRKRKSTTSTQKQWTELLVVAGEINDRMQSLGTVRTIAAMSNDAARSGALIAALRQASTLQRDCNRGTLAEAIELCKTALAEDSQ